MIKMMKTTYYFFTYPFFIKTTSANIIYIHFYLGKKNNFGKKILH